MLPLLDCSIYCTFKLISYTFLRLNLCAISFSRSISAYVIKAKGPLGHSHLLMLPHVFFLARKSPYLARSGASSLLRLSFMCIFTKNYKTQWNTMTQNKLNAATKAKCSIQRSLWNSMSKARLSTFIQTRPRVVIRVSSAQLAMFRCVWSSIV